MIKWIHTGNRLPIQGMAVRTKNNEGEEKELIRKDNQWYLPDQETVAPTPKEWLDENARE